eukprot:837901_1
MQMEEGNVVMEENNVVMGEGNVAMMKNKEERSKCGNGRRQCGDGVSASEIQIPVCHYEKSQHMWVAKMIKKAGKSSILPIDWSPNNMYIIAGGSDFKCRIFSAYIKGVDTEGLWRSNRHRSVANMCDKRWQYH